MDSLLQKKETERNIEEVEGGGEKQRRIKLRCPSASMSKIVELVAGEDHKLDLDFISRAFGIEPYSLKLNGHFISRGLDLIACSVTWRSLLSFFSARGFSTGATDFDAIIVDGKLSKFGSKRKHESECIGNSSLNAKQYGGCDPNDKSELSNVEFVSKRRLKDFRQGLLNKIAQTGSHCSSLKRKFLSVDSHLTKRTRTKEADTSIHSNEVDTSRRISSGQVSCNNISRGDNLKRLREDDMAVAAPCNKRLYCVQP